MSRTVSACLANTLVVLAAGCSIVCPASIRSVRPEYSIAVQQTNNEEVLLNLVRLRYRDTPMFLKTASITTSFTFEAFGQASTTVVPSNSDLYSAVGRVTYAEQPTISYAPLQGEAYVTQLFEPIELETLMLLSHSGWSIERLLRVAVQSINGIPNAPTASGPTPDQAPEYEQFMEVAGLFRKMQQNRDAVLGDDTEGREGGIKLRILPGASDREHVQQLLAELKLENLPTYNVAEDVARGGGDTIAVVTRSMMGCLYYLSHGVDGPSVDRDDGRVTITLDSEENEFDWSGMLDTIMRVRSSTDRPDRPYVAVPYRGSWFYLEDTDLDSKSTFTLLTQLLEFQSSEVPATGPVLTIPTRQ
jgi:hypothetical protein